MWKQEMAIIVSNLGSWTQTHKHTDTHRHTNLTNMQTHLNIKGAKALDTQAQAHRQTGTQALKHTGTYEELTAPPCSCCTQHTLESATVRASKHPSTFMRKDGTGTEANVLSTHTRTNIEAIKQRTVESATVRAVKARAIAVSGCGHGT